MGAQGSRDHGATQNLLDTTTDFLLKSKHCQAKQNTISPETVIT